MKETLELCFERLYDLSEKLRLVREEITKIQEEIAPHIKE